jgi:hypothetical protein
MILHNDDAKPTTLREVRAFSSPLAPDIAFTAAKAAKRLRRALRMVADLQD